VWLGRPTETFARLLALALHCYHQSWPYGVHDQGSLAFAMDNLYKSNFTYVEALCNEGNDTLKEEIQNTNKLMMVGTMKKLEYDGDDAGSATNKVFDSVMKAVLWHTQNTTSYTERRSQDLEKIPRAVALLATRWMNSPICPRDEWKEVKVHLKGQTVATELVGDWTTWQPGDFIAHFYGCKEDSEIVKTGRMRVASKKSSIAVPPNTNVDWNQFVNFSILWKRMPEFTRLKPPWHKRLKQAFYGAKQFVGETYQDIIHFSGRTGL